MTIIELLFFVLIVSRPLFFCSSAASPGGGSGSPTVVSEPVFFGSDHTNCHIVSNFRIFRIEIKTLRLAARPPPCTAAPSSPRRAHLRALDTRLAARWPCACRAKGAERCCNRRKKLRQRAARLPCCVRPMMGATSRASSRAAAHVLRYWPPAVASWMRRLVDAARHSRARCCGRARLASRENFSCGGRRPAAAPTMLRRVSGDVVTAGLISSRVWFGPVCDVGPGFDRF
ncbi:hypothetical protein F511_43742 [Dorcoceras hygrometricum]|uniref:Secreted protein n=1 Tax=Dorcoceras hygrometricum TaxID=472368 RepID=A0A2Z7ADH5_9LAMI|nr:hypothetical protein F511_43742 [Dorcoceras hygrometricum]